MNLRFKALSQSQLSPSEMAGTMTVTDDGNLYVAKSDSSQLKITDVIFVDDLPLEGLEDKIYVNLANQTLNYFDNVTSNWVGTDGNLVNYYTKDEIDEKLSKSKIEFFNTTTELPINGESGILYVVEFDQNLNDPAIYVWNEVNQEYKLMSGKGSTGEVDVHKDIVFVLGDDLTEGGQPFTEIVFPYMGKIEKINVNIGLDSDNSSNLIFSLQKRVGTSWANIHVMELQTGEYAKVFELNENISNDRLRINLINGDFSRVSSMTIITQVKIN